jgi:hypothetical protein
MALRKMLSLVGGTLFFGLAVLLWEARAQAIPALPKHEKQPKKEHSPQRPSGEALARPSSGQPGEDDGFLDFSELDRKFRVVSLGKDIANTLESLSPASQIENINAIPSGLRMFVLWNLSEESILRLLRHNIEKNKDRNPSVAVALESMATKAAGMISSMRAAMQGRHLNAKITEVFFASLTPQERAILEKSDFTADLKLSGAYFTLVDYLRISPKGEEFLRKISVFSPTARELLSTLPPGYSSLEAFSGNFIYDDGFLCVLEKDFVASPHP